MPTRVIDRWRWSLGVMSTLVLMGARAIAGRAGPPSPGRAGLSLAESAAAAWAADAALVYLGRRRGRGRRYALGLFFSTTRPARGYSVRDGIVRPPISIPLQSLPVQGPGSGGRALRAAD